MDYPSKLVERAVEEISRLPGIGKKTALRLTLFLLKQPESFTGQLTAAMDNLRTNVKYCRKCHMISDGEVCNTCNSSYRDSTIICVVEDSPDVLAILNTGQYSGHFHVLGGRISPMDGIGPDQIRIDSLIDRIKEAGDVKEIILALSATMEGDTTAYYINRLLKEIGMRVTTIARGIPIGSEIEYADEITLGRSITTRTEVGD